MFSLCLRVSVGIFPADTTACIAGGLAGLREGFDAIPSRWMDALRVKEFVEPILARLLAQPREREA